MKTLKPVIPWLLLLLLLTGTVAVYLDRARQRAELSKLQAELASLQGTREELDALRTRQHELERQRENAREIENLREETGSLKKTNETLQAQLEELRQSNAAAQSRLQAENQELRRQYSQLEADSELERLQQQIRLRQAQPLGQGLLQYVEENDGNLPNAMGEVKRYLGDSQNQVDLDSYEILTKGRLDNVSNPAETPWARQKQPGAQQERIYIYLDGHVDFKAP